jgi:DNA/RNA endonuclease YhcR with UshA esterase domain
MKKILVAIALIVAMHVSVNAQNIKPEQAASHVGETVTVCGKIFGGKFFDRSESKITLLNMGAAFPKSPLTIVIAGDDRKNFKSAPEEFYSEKTVCVKGVVKEYKGKPQIFIKTEEDITVQE